MKRSSFVICVVTLMLAAYLPVTCVQAQSKKLKIKITSEEMQEVVSRAGQLGDALKNVLSLDEEERQNARPELLEHFERPDLGLDVTRDQRKWRRRLKKIERRKRCRKRKKKKNRPLLSGLEAEEDADCATLCAWAAAWAEASCFAIACAECPGGTIRFCASFSARAYGYGVGVACVSACVEDDIPADPECDAGGVL